jgi:DNA repair protein RecO (recombination protein O)
MEETYSTKIIILNRYDFRERDSKVAVYTEDRGKLNLVVRGTKTLKSKLAGHIEPFNEVDIMVARGRIYDYLAGASTRQAFFVIKSDVDRLEFAGKGVKLFNDLIREGLVDQNLFELLNTFLSELNKKAISFSTVQFIYSSYVLKLFSLLGYSPILDRCVACGKVAVGTSFLFDYKRGGIVCTPCTHYDTNIIQLSEEVRKVLQYIVSSPAADFVYPPLFEAELGELVRLIDNFSKYHKPV